MRPGERIVMVVGAVVAACALVLGGVVVALMGVAGTAAVLGATAAMSEPTSSGAVPLATAGIPVASNAPSGAGPAPAPTAAVVPPPVAGQPSSGTAASNAQSLAGSPAAGASSARQIAVYFSRHPQSDADFSAVFPVSRTADSAGVARAAILALIAGPTPDESTAGYFSEVGANLIGPSTCGDTRFTVVIESGVATLRFCQLLQSAGIGQDARMMSSITATLRQFPTVQKVRVLTHDGHCMFDMSGEDRCLRDR